MFRLLHLQLFSLCNFYLHLSAALATPNCRILLPQQGNYDILLELPAPFSDNLWFREYSQVKVLIYTISVLFSHGIFLQFMPVYFIFSQNYKQLFLKIFVIVFKCLIELYLINLMEYFDMARQYSFLLHIFTSNYIIKKQFHKKCRENTPFLFCKMGYSLIIWKQFILGMAVICFIFLCLDQNITYPIMLQNAYYCM